jgi:hypothetical protein
MPTESFQQLFEVHVVARRWIRASLCVGVRAGRTEFGYVEPRAVENEWNDLHKCQLKPVSPRDYSQRMRIAT